MRLSVVLDCGDPDALVEFWAAALGYRPVESPPGYRVLIDADGPPARPFVLQRVSEPRVTKNRMHLDVHPPLELGVPAHVQRLVALGGRTLGAPVTELLESHGIWWQVMADPEGNEFCVVADPGHPAPV
jgi:catechol 2,3-dioxygenase-like lactoylglutathione lyase family enzyme